MIVNVVHFPMLAFGFAMGILLLGAIARTTSRAIKVARIFSNFKGSLRLNILYFIFT